MAITPAGNMHQAASAYQANAPGESPQGGEMPGMRVLRQQNRRVRENPPEVDRMQTPAGGGNRSLAIETDKGTVVDVIG